MRYPLDWNDLRYFLAVARAGTLSAAARALKVNAGTVSRRISAMELALGTRCFERRPEGYPLTELGRTLFDHAERVEREIVSLDRAIDASDPSISGVVSLTTAEALASEFVIPVLPGLRGLYPDLRIEVIADFRVMNLSRREADFAIRLARSEQGELLSRRIGYLRFGLYASEAYLQENGTPRVANDLVKHNFIDGIEDYPRAAPAVWFRSFSAQSTTVLKVNGARLRMTAAELGMGITLLPFPVVRNSNLRRILPAVDIPPLEIWLLTHPETAKIRRVRTVMDYIAEKAVENERLLEVDSRAEFSAETVT